MVISEDIDVSYFALSLGEQQVPFLEYGEKIRMSHDITIF
jgi:hypothetical protein